MKEEAVKNEVERRETRFERRLKARKQEFLNTLVNLFFTDRSSLKDPEGEEADAIFIKYRDMWIDECKAFNKAKRLPFKLRGEAFTEQVDKVIEMEKTNQKKIEEQNKIKDFRHWLRLEANIKKMPFRTFWYWLISRGNKEKKTQLWKHYYIIWLDKP
jgi:hypothetical protein